MRRRDNLILGNSFRQRSVAIRAGAGRPMFGINSKMLSLAIGTSPQLAPSMARPNLFSGD